jgi:hypothetical protein
MIGIFRSFVAASRLVAGPLAAIPLTTLLLAAILLLAVPARATGATGGTFSGPPPAATVDDGALPATLDETAIRDMVSRLSDAEAREMLLEQLDALARQRAATVQPDAGFVRDFRGSLQRIREGLAELGAAVPQVPTIGPMIAGRLTEDGDLRACESFGGVAGLAMGYRAHGDFLV